MRLPSLKSAGSGLPPHAAGSLHSHWLRRAVPQAFAAALLTMLLLGAVRARTAHLPPLLLLISGFLPLHAAAAGTLLLGAFRQQSASPAQALALAPRPPHSLWRSFLLAVPAMAAYIPVGILLAALSSLALRQFGLAPAPSLLFGFMDEGSSPLLVSAALAGALAVAPFSEEIVFRLGLHDFLEGLEVRFPGFWVAVLFALVHAQPFAIPTLLVLSLLLQRLRRITGSLWCPVFAHALFNLFGILAYFLSTGQRGAPQ